MANSQPILYVEDNLENRILVRRLLMSEGYKLVEAENAFQAIELVKTFVPSLILMDINMPDLDGYTLTGKLRLDARLQQVPIIALTANVMKRDRERTLEAGCNGYIEKPIDVDRFLDQIQKFLPQN